MMEVHAFATPNSVKVPIALEEMGVAYALKLVNIRQGEQKTSAFLALNPNAKVPVLIDPQGPTGTAVTLTESAAILVYLAEKTGMLLPAAGIDRARVFEQLFFHASTLGPAFGNAGFFKRLVSEPQPLAEARFAAEAGRVLDLLEVMLGERRFMAGDDYSIADIAHFGWLWRREFSGMSFDGRPHLARWFEGIAERPAVRRALARVEALISQA